MERKTLQAEEFSVFFLQESGRWVLMPRIPLTREQMRLPSYLWHFPSSPVTSAQLES